MERDRAAALAGFVRFLSGNPHGDAAARTMVLGGLAPYGFIAGQIYAMGGTEHLELVGNFQQGLGLGEVTFKNADYVVFGTIESPDLRTGPRDEFTVNPFTGEGKVGKQEVPFMLTVPKITERFKPPFPVLFYFHGTGSSRMESLVVSDAMARQGWATLAFDEVGHGPLVPDIRKLVEEEDSSIRPVLNALPVFHSFGLTAGTQVKVALPAGESLLTVVSIRNPTREELDRLLREIKPPEFDEDELEG